MKTPAIIETFLGYVRDELAYSELTVLTYRADLGHWLNFLSHSDITVFEPQSVTVNDIRAWVASMSRKNLSAATIKQRLSAVRAFYRFMIKRHGLKHNPASGVRINRRGKTLPKFIDTGEMCRVLDGMENEAAVTNDFESVRNTLIINMLYQTGMRASELTALTDSRVDLVRNELKVLGKRSKERIIPFGEHLQRQIEQYYALRPVAMTGSQPFFTDSEGSALKYSQVYRIVHEALDGNVSSTKRSPHVLRHTFATDMLNNGADLTSVRELLGHTSLATTQIYTHVTASELYENYYRAHPRARKNTNT